MSILEKTFQFFYVTDKKTSQNYALYTTVDMSSPVHANNKIRNILGPNCEYECDKSCDIGEFLDYKSCKCRNKIIDKLLEECSENIDGNEILYNETLDAIPLNAIFIEYNSIE